MKNSIKQKIRQDKKAYDQLQDFGFAPCGVFGVAYIEFFGELMAFKSFSDALNFVNSIK